MEQVKNLIIGAGISGLGAAHSLKLRGEDSLVLEQENTYGGLCGNFEIDGFRFDRFVHLSFAQKEKCATEIFEKSCPDARVLQSNPFNIYKGQWIKHPAQNNLYPLSEEEKKLVIDDFIKRPELTEENKPRNYEEWLRLQFGNYFAEHFPMAYTRKYWMKEACELRTEWTGGRFYQPSVDEVIEGSKTPDTPTTYYSKEMLYPAKGGFKSFLKDLAEEANIRMNTGVTRINTTNKTVWVNGSEDGFIYDRLISSMPLPEIIKIIEDVPADVKEAASKLEATHGYHVSIALKGNNIPPYLWWYIYDEDNLSARVHSPSLKSPDNVPEGCSSLQMEVYCDKDEYTEEELLRRTVGKLVEIGAIKDEDILFTHLGYEKYANVIFSEPIYGSREIVMNYLKSVGIDTIGRFGEWDYLWSDQALKSGLDIH